jgi:hypothetical protein
LVVTLPLKAIGVNGAMLKASLNKSWNRVTDPTTGERRRFSNYFRTLGELHFAYDLPQRKLNLGFDAFYYGRQRLYRPNGWEGPDAWMRLLLFVEYRARPNLVARFEVNNATGAKTLLQVASFAGARDRSPLLYLDRRNLGIDPYAFVRLRKTF